MAFPLVGAGLVAVRVMGKGIQHLTKKKAAQAVKEGWGSIVKPKKPYSQIKKERQATVQAQRRAAADKKKAKQKVHGEHIRAGTDYGSQGIKAWRNLTPAQRTKASQSLGDLEANIAGSTKVIRKTTTPTAKKGMRFGRQGETTSRKRGCKIMIGYKAGGKV